MVRICYDIDQKNEGGSLNNKYHNVLTKRKIVFLFSKIFVIVVIAKRDNND